MTADCPWCIMEAGEDGKRFVCERCGQRYVFELPMSITQFCRLSKAFIELHRDCKEALPKC